MYFSSSLTYEWHTASPHPQGDAVAQSVERTTLGEEVLNSIPAGAAHSVLVRGVLVYCNWPRQKSWSRRSVS